MKALAPSRRKSIAGLFFLVAALVGFYGSAYYYLASQYPTSAEYISRHMGSAEITGVFKVEEAKTAGYSETEIATYLAKANAEELDRYLSRIILIELTIFFVALLITIALVVLNAGPSRRQPAGDRTRHR